MFKLPAGRTPVSRAQTPYSATGQKYRFVDVSGKDVYMQKRPHLPSRMVQRGSPGSPPANPNLSPSLRRNDTRSRRSPSERGIMPSWNPSTRVARPKDKFSKSEKVLPSTAESSKGSHRTVERRKTSEQVSDHKSKNDDGESWAWKEFENLVPLSQAQAQPAVSEHTSTPLEKPLNQEPPKLSPLSKTALPTTFLSPKHEMTSAPILADEKPSVLQIPTSPQADHLQEVRHSENISSNASPVSHSPSNILPPKSSPLSSPPPGFEDVQIHGANFDEGKSSDEDEAFFNDIIHNIDDAAMNEVEQVDMDQLGVRGSYLDIARRTPFNEASLYHHRQLLTRQKDPILTNKEYGPPVETWDEDPEMDGVTCSHYAIPEWIALRGDFKDSTEGHTLFMSIMEKPGNERTEIEINTLKKFIPPTTFADGLPEEVIPKFFRSLSIQTVKAREYLYKVGEEGTLSYFVYSGSVKTFGKEYNVTLSRGSVFGVPSEIVSQGVASRATELWGLVRTAVKGRNLNAPTEQLILQMMDQKHKRDDSAMAVTDSIVVCVAHQQIHRLQDVEEMHRKRMSTKFRHQLRALPLLKSWHTPWLKTIAGAVTANSFPNGARIVSQGQPANTFYFILSGKVSLDRDVKLTQINRVPGGHSKWNMLETGQGKTFFTEERSDFFGEECLFGQNHSCFFNIKAIGTVDLLSLPASILRDVLGKEFLIKKCIEEFRQRMHASTKKMEVRIEKAVRDRKADLAMKSNLTNLSFEAAQHTLTLTAGNFARALFMVENGSELLKLSLRNEEDRSMSSAQGQAPLTDKSLKLRSRSRTPAAANDKSNLGFARNKLASPMNQSRSRLTKLQPSASAPALSRPKTEGSNRTFSNSRTSLKKPAPFTPYGKYWEARSTPGSKNAARKQKAADHLHTSAVHDSIHNLAIRKNLPLTRGSQVTRQEDFSAHKSKQIGELNAFMKKPRSVMKTDSQTVDGHANPNAATAIQIRDHGGYGSVLIDFGKIRTTSPRDEESKQFRIRKRKPPPLNGIRRIGNEMVTDFNGGAKTSKLMGLPATRRQATNQKVVDNFSLIEDANGVAYFEVKANEKDEFNEEHCYLTMAKKQEELQRKLDQESLTRKRGANAVVALLSKKSRFKALASKARAKVAERKKIEEGETSQPDDGSSSDGEGCSEPSDSESNSNEGDAFSSDDNDQGEPPLPRKVEPTQTRTSRSDCQDPNCSAGQRYKTPVLSTHFDSMLNKKGFPAADVLAAALDDSTTAFLFPPLPTGSTEPY